MKIIYKFILLVISKVFVLLTKITGFFNMSVFLSKLSFSYGNIIRYYYYKSVLISVGENVFFPYGVIFSCPEISIGNNVRFGPYNTIGLVDFEDNVLIAQNVHFLSGNKQHSYDRRDIPINRQAGELTRIRIKEDVWIGCGAIIMDNINTGSVIGSGAIVNKEYEEYSIIAGNPAKVIKKR